jgi:hypothetical protein
MRTICFSWFFKQTVGVVVVVVVVCRAVRKFMKNCPDLERNSRGSVTVLLCMSYFKVLTVSEIIPRIASNVRFIREWWTEKIGNKTVLSQSRCKPHFAWKVMQQEKTSVSMSGATAKVQSRQHSKLSLQTFRHTKLFGKLISNCMIIGSALWTTPMVWTHNEKLSIRQLVLAFYLWNYSTDVDKIW